MHIDPFTARVTLNQFGGILRGAKRISVMSDEMARKYASAYGVSTVILRHGLTPQLWHPQRREMLSPGTVRIGFAGSLYAKNEWGAFLSAIASNGGSVAGRAVEVWFLGHRPRWPRFEFPFVKYCGSRSLEGTVRGLADVDICYLPYWFDEAHAPFARMSFPSKLSCYIAAGAPVFLHCPEYASPSRFHETYPVGICCHSLSASAILDGLTSLIEDARLRTLAADAREAALNHELGAGAMMQAFYRLVGIDSEGWIIPAARAVREAEKSQNEGLKDSAASLIPAD
jgi:hypothetical protein